MFVVNQFNDFFFTKIGPSLATKIPHTTVGFKSYLSGYFVDSFLVSPTTYEENINIDSSSALS